MILSATFLVLSLAWITYVVGRLPSDIQEVREGDWAERLAVMVIWLVTAILVLWCGTFIWQFAKPILSYFP